MRARIAGAAPDGASFAYPGRAGAAALGRAASGLALTLGPLALVRTTATAAAVLGVLGLVFLVYGARAIARQRTRLTIDAAAIRAEGPLAIVIPWDELASVRLNYYTTKRGGDGGWMVLAVKGRKGRTMRIESTLDGFATVVARVVREALRRGIALPPATHSNLRAFGLAAEPAPPESVARCRTS